MTVKTLEKIKAIELRKQGKTYSEILKEVKVAKSTLSLWLREVGLAKGQKQRITEKRRESQRKAARRCREIRLEKQAKIIEEAKKEIGKLSKKDFFLLGIILYWAEGSKEKVYRTSETVSFCNTDPKMIELFRRWLNDILLIGSEQLTYSIYIHKGQEKRIEEVKRYWADIISEPVDRIDYVYFKKHNPKTVRKNVGEHYFGTFRINVRKSTDLNRKIAGWIAGVIKGIDLTN